MRKTLFVLAVAALFCAAPRTAHAKVSSLENARMGQHWFGPDRSLESLKGHIVLWENWGYN